MRKLQQCCNLTHWGRDKMAAISLTTLSNAFSWMTMLEFRIKFHWSLFIRVQLTISQHWFRWWLGADQATSHYLNQWWLDYRRIYASLGLNELTSWMSTNIQQRTMVVITYPCHNYSWSLLAKGLKADNSLLSHQHTQCWLDEARLVSWSVSLHVNTLRLRQNGRHFLECKYMNYE